MRLNLFIAKSGAASRRGADEIVKNGQVQVNGQIVREPFFRLSEDDRVLLRGRPLKAAQKIYFLFHKPRGVICTRMDRHASSKVTDFFPPFLGSIFPVGRLDKDSQGLLIMTNDGHLCYKLTHPRFEIEKEYRLRIIGRLDPESCRKMKQGVRDKGDLLRVKYVWVIRRTAKSTICAAVVCEGKKRHLRRLFSACGFKVESLLRVRVGGLLLGKLKPGQYRQISNETASRAMINPQKQNPLKINKKVLL